MSVLRVIGAAPLVVAVDVDGVVHPVTVEIVSGAIEQAREQGAEIVLVRINTPGGLMTAMRETIEKMMASPVPVVTYVTPSGGRAASAGFFLLEAGDVAAMAPGTNTGAAHPVMLGGGEMDAVTKQKVENDAAAYLRSLVTRRGRNTELAEKAVLESKSFTEKEALDGKLIELVARDQAALLESLHGREVEHIEGTKVTLNLENARVVEYEKSLRQRILSAVSDPNIALLLLVLGALGVYIEFSSPGLILPGVAGAILALLGLAAISVLPINWMGAALLVLALALFVLEAKFASGGILGAGGALAMILGAVLLIDSPLPEMRIRLITAIALTLPFAILTVFLLTLALKARAAKVTTGSDGMIDQVGVTLTALDPLGRVFVHGEYWSAEADRTVPEGARVRVVGIDGLQLKVEPVSGEGGEKI